MRRYTTPLDVQMLQRAGQSLSVSVMEDLSLQSIADHVRDWLPSISGALGKIFSAPSDLHLPVILDTTSTIKTNAFLHTVENRVKYLDVRKARISKPSGLKTTYPVYLQQLEHMAHDSSKVAINVVQPFNRFLAGLVSSPVARVSSASLDINLDKLKAEREERSKIVASHIDPLDQSDMTTYDRLVERNSDWKTVIHSYEKAQGDIARVGVDKLRSDVREACMYLDALHRNLSADKSSTTTPAVAQDIANIALEIAQQIDYYATTCYRLMLVQGALNKNFVEVTALAR